MSNSTKLADELQTILSGKPWYGHPVYYIIDKVTFESAYQKSPGALHNIAGIVLHMLAWTEEAITRMQHQRATEPLRGDWPDVGDPNEQKWIQLVNYLKLANVELIQMINNFPEDKWQAATNDDRDADLDGPVTYERLINGLIQHHVYHAGQISLLNKMSNG